MHIFLQADTHTYIYTHTMPLVCLTCGDQLYGAFSASGLPPAAGSAVHDLPSVSSAAAADATSALCADPETAAAPAPTPTPTPLLLRPLPPAAHADSRGAHPQLSASLFLRHPLAASSSAALHATRRQSDASASRESGGVEDMPSARVASSSASSSVSVALSDNCSLAATLDAPAPAKDSPTAGTTNGAGDGDGDGDGTPLHQQVRPLARSGSSSGHSSFAYLGSPAHGGAPATPTPAAPTPAAPAARGAMPHMQSCESFVDLQAACPATPVAAAAANGGVAGPSATAAAPAAAPAAAAAHETSPTAAAATPTTTAPAAAASVFQRATPLPLQERALKNTLFYQKMLITRHVARLGAREVALPGPLCVMCRDAVLKQPLQNAREAARDEAVMRDALERALSCSPPDEGEAAAADAEAADVAAETAALRAELCALDAAVASGAAELRSLAAAADEAEQATDALLRTAAAAAHHAAATAVDEEESEDNRCRYLTEEFAMSSGVGGLPFVFHFECSRIPGSINGHRLGSPYPSEQAGARQQAVVGWEEVNAALGHLALFVKSVATSIGCKGRALGFILEGSNSKVAVSGDEGVTYYSLFSKEGSSTTSVDEALVHLNCELSSLAKLVRVGLPYGSLYECDLLIADGHNPLWESSMLKILCNAEALMNGVHGLIQKRKEQDARQSNQDQPPQRVAPSAPKHTPAASNTAV